MLQPILSIQNLKTYFRQDEGIVKAVDGASFDVYPGKTVGVVGESGCGKSVTARSILQIVDKGGSIEGGNILLRRPNQSGQVDEIDLAALDPNSREMRSVRGDEIALIFQEPMTAFSPVHTVGDQIMESILLHIPGISKKQAAGILEHIADDLGAGACIGGQGFEFGEQGVVHEIQQRVARAPFRVRRPGAPLQVSRNG